MSSKTVSKTQMFENMTNEMKKLGIDFVVFKDVKPDPTFGVVDDALSLCNKENCEAVIAIGGGSIIDASKGVVAAFTNGNDPRKLEGLLKVKNDTLPFIAIPTTAGTGSEVTLAAVISDDETHKKTTIVSPKIVPSVAVLDPELTVGLPKHLTATTTMDALTHALEAYTNTYATEETDGYALKAINLICSNIEKSFNQPTDLEAREALLVGSFYAGMAFTRTFVGYVHAFSHNIGGSYGVSHGLGNAVILPHVMESYKEVREDKFAHLADFLNVASTADTKKEKADKFIKYLFDLNKRLDLPTRIEKFPKSGVDKILNDSFKECHGTYPVPRYYSKEEARELLNKVCAV